jgi:hypothetical protein
MTTRPPRMTLFKPVYLDQRVELTPMELAKASADIDAFLLTKIRKRLEGVCCTHGYVRHGSTQILARSMGQAEHGRFTADFLYYCKVKVLCLMPHADQVVSARILKTNKLGAYALIVDGDRVYEAMRILVPRDLNLGNQEFDDLKVGQGIRIRLLRSRFQVNDAFIQAVGTYEGLAPDADAPAGGPKGGDEVVHVDVDLPEGLEEEQPPTSSLLGPPPAISSTLANPLTA